MAIRIRSLLSWGPLWLPLTGGRDLRLTPGEFSPVISDTEIQDNKVVEKLLMKGMIEVLPVSTPEQPEQAVETEQQYLAAIAEQYPPTQL